jgi:hypothetical protein
MTTGTLLDHSLGVALETTWDRAVTPDHFHEWLPSSGFDYDPNTVQGKGLRQGSTFPRSARRVALVPMVNGKIELELLSVGMGVLLKSGFGTGTSTNVSGALYQQLFTASISSAVSLPSFTAQEGIVRADGTIDSYTARGCSMKSLEIEVPSGGIASAKFDVDARHLHAGRSVTDGATTNSSATLTSLTASFATNDVGASVSGTGIPANTRIASVESATSATMSANATATGTGVTVTIGLAYTTPTYPTGGTLYSSALPLTGAMIVGGTMTVPTTTVLGSISGGTTAVGVKSWSLSLDNGLDVKRDVLGGRNQATTGERKGTLKTVIEYDATTGRTLRDAQINQSPLPILLTATTPEIITAGNPATAQIAIPVAAIDKGAIPQPTEGTVAVTTIEWTILDGLSAAYALYMALRTADTAL